MPLNKRNLIIPIAFLLYVGGNVGKSYEITPAQAIPQKSGSTTSLSKVDSTSTPHSGPASGSDQSTIVPKKTSQAAPDSSWWSRKIEHPEFNLGERLEFSVKYGKIPAGTAILELTDTTTYDNHLCYHVTSTASSNDFVSVFYRVRDTVETYLDVAGVFPRRFRKLLREGNYKMDRITEFDQRKHLAITGNDTVPTYAFVQDPLSSLYFIRTQKLVPGKDILIDNHTDKKNYPLKVIVYRKERVEVPAGTFDCVVIEPVMRAQGIFQAKGRIWIWITDDEYKMPVMMKSEVYFLGSVSAQLSSYRHGKIG